jgi:hypothetical protein
VGVLVAGIYRATNAGPLHRILDPVPREWRVALWALDDVIPAVADRTVGSGVGGKFGLLNETLARAGRDDTLVLIDDDAWLTRGSFADLVRIAADAGFDLAQPAHDRESKSTYTFNRRRAATIARETTFVEIGPILVLRGRAPSTLLPFPADIGMGWGLELLWRRERARGLRMGVVDAVAVHHPDPPNATYAEGASVEYDRVDRLLAEDGLSNIRDAQRTVGRWWRGRRRPPRSWRR